mmetsp:Transcript_30870/g.39590  ORF Transcript_30870/g.39590 Transcript_30870/m.39590 type:complete len:276 (-) Transcript_30870:59-886(-)
MAEVFDEKIVPNFGSPSDLHTRSKIWSSISEDTIQFEIKDRNESDNLMTTFLKKSDANESNGSNNRLDQEYLERRPQILLERPLSPQHIQGCLNHLNLEPHLYNITNLSSSVITKVPVSEQELTDYTVPNYVLDAEVVKSLAFYISNDEIAVCILPVSKQVHLTRLASALSRNKDDIQLIPPDRLVSVCGYKRGCIGPIGLRSQPVMWELFGRDQNIALLRKPNIIIVLDSRLASNSTGMLFGAGAQNIVYFARPSCLISKLEQVLVADFTSSIV